MDNVARVKAYKENKCSPNPVISNGYVVVIFVRKYPRHF